MNFNFTKEQELIQRSAREFAEKNIEPIAEQIDQANEVPETVIKGLADLDIFGLSFPEEYDGAGADKESFVLVIEQLARASQGVSMIVSAGTVALETIHFLGTEDQKRRFLPPCCRGGQISSFAFTEPGTGSDPKQLATTYTLDGDHYVLNGTKRFISNANFKGPMLVFAKESETGKVSAFIGEKWIDGYSVSEPWKKLGLHGGPLLDVYLKDYRVPRENLLGEAGQGFDILQTGIAFGKLGSGACSLGGILSAYDEGLKYATEKLHRGAPIAKFQTVQMAIAQLVMLYEQTRWVCYRLGQLANNPKNIFAYRKEAALAKAVAGTNHVEAAKVMMDIHGSYGLMMDYRAQRIYRDAIMMKEVEGVTDLQKIVVAGTILAGMR